MSATASALKNALVIDFTGTAAGFTQVPSLAPQLVQVIRTTAAGKTLIAIDREVGGRLKAPAVVRDHLNLTGTSPLLGPNDPCGDRFPVVQGIYIDDVLPALPKVVAAGVKSGVKLDADDLRLIENYGAEACCCNIVPTMLVAAHARCRLLAILLPQGAGMPADLEHELKLLIGGA